MTKGGQSWRKREAKRRARSSGTVGRGPVVYSFRGGSVRVTNSVVGDAAAGGAFQVPKVLQGFVAPHPLYAPTDAAMVYNQDPRTPSPRCAYSTRSAMMSSRDCQKASTTASSVSLEHDHAAAVGGSGSHRGSRRGSSFAASCIVNHARALHDYYEYK